MQNIQKTYYEILGISVTATQEEIKSAFRKLVKKYHPDANPNQDTTKEMQEITEAYEILSNLEKRKKYDNELKRKGIYYKKENRPQNTSDFSKADSKTNPNYQYYSYTQTREESEYDFDEQIKILLKKYRYYYEKVRKYNTERESYFNSNIQIDNIEYYNIDTSFFRKETKQTNIDDQDTGKVKAKILKH